MSEIMNGDSDFKTPPKSPFCYKTSITDCKLQLLLWIPSLGSMAFKGLENFVIDPEFDIKPGIVAILVPMPETSFRIGVLIDGRNFSGQELNSWINSDHYLEIVLTQSDSERVINRQNILIYPSLAKKIAAALQFQQHFDSQQFEKKALEYINHYSKVSPAGMVTYFLDEKR